MECSRLFRALERRFAGFKRTQGSLYFSSGYLANLGVLTTLTERGDVVFSDELNHASLIDGVRLSAARRVVFPHNDVDRLARLLDDPEPNVRAAVLKQFAEHPSAKIVKQVADAHGGTIVAERAPEGGTIMRLRFGAENGNCDERAVKS